MRFGCWIDFLLRYRNIIDTDKRPGSGTVFRNWGCAGRARSGGAEGTAWRGGGVLCGWRLVPGGALVRGPRCGGCAGAVVGGAARPGRVGARGRGLGGVRVGGLGAAGCLGEGRELAGLPELDEVFQAGEDAGEDGGDHGVQGKAQHSPPGARQGNLVQAGAVRRQRGGGMIFHASLVSDIFARCKVFFLTRWLDGEVCEHR